MAKVIRRYVCQQCGATATRWEGKCPSCQSWNSYTEEYIQKSSGSPRQSRRDKTEKQHVAPVRISEITSEPLARILVKDEELNRALGGGIVPGSIILISGQPGIGKSTLLLQLAGKNAFTVLFVSGEESSEQIRIRASRIGTDNDACYLYCETDLDKILDQAQKVEPHLVIIDSIQTLSSSLIESSPGTITQVRECTHALQRFAKETNTPVFIIGHITKEGSIAGPKVLEHIVDVVIQFEGDRHYNYRVLRTNKNRFGSTDEIGIYEMRSEGLMPVANPSELLISQSSESLSGSAIAATIEGLRPLLIETQALVTTAVYGTPQRSVTGFDLRRLHMLLAVLEKRSGFQFGSQDVFLNLAGGIKVSDPAIDLAIVASLVSSLEDIPIEQTVCFAGEVGLSGEIRAVNFIEQRIQEANRLGFREMYVPKNNAKSIQKAGFDLKIHYISRVDELVGALFG
jgi:DNA repair protein RadA/Sms